MSNLLFDELQEEQIMYNENDINQEFKELSRHVMLKSLDTH